MTTVTTGGIVQTFIFRAVAIFAIWRGTVRAVQRSIDEVYR